MYIFYIYVSMSVYVCIDDYRPVCLCMYLCLSMYVPMTTDQSVYVCTCLCMYVCTYTCMNICRSDYRPYDACMHHSSYYRMCSLTIECVLFL